MTTQGQSDSELRVFRAFVAAAGLPVVDGTIQKREPPQADIECELSSGERLAFELVEVVDADFARLVSDQIRMERSLQDHYAVDPIDGFSDGLIYVRFVGDAPVRQRERAKPDLFQFLRALPDGYEGDVKVPSGTALASAVRSVRVSRGDWVGPHFQVEAGAFISDPVLDRIAGKFGKHYDVDTRLELLAYYELHPVRPPEMWQPDIEDYLRARLPASQFSRAWVFDVGSRSVLFDSASPKKRTALPD